MREGARAWVPLADPELMVLESLEEAQHAALCVCFQSPGLSHLPAPHHHCSFPPEAVQLACPRPQVLPRLVPVIHLYSTRPCAGQAFQTSPHSIPPADPGEWAR